MNMNMNMNMYNEYEYEYEYQYQYEYEYEYESGGIFRRVLWARYDGPGCPMESLQNCFTKLLEKCCVQQSFSK